MIKMEAIGVFEGKEHSKYALPRQPGLKGSPGRIRLEPHRNFEQAVKDLELFDRVWVLYCFHENKGWKPLVRPPGQKQKRGVFATRSPHRPNPIGLSCVRLVRVEGLRIYVDECDMLDGTPVLDIKPYIAYADAYPEASTGWVEPQEPFAVTYGESALASIEALLAEGGPDLRTAIEGLLALDPYPNSHNRVTLDGEQGVYACQYWRIHFVLDADARALRVTEVRSTGKKKT